jgi:hypothetical protein
MGLQARHHVSNLSLFATCYNTFPLLFYFLLEVLLGLPYPGQYQSLIEESAGWIIK